MDPREETIIRSWITKERKPRWLESLDSDAKRPRMLGKLNHCRDLDERFTTLLPSNCDIVELLQENGAPGTCYVLSACEDIDGREMELAEAIRQATLGGWGTIISCVPGKLAYFYDECGERKILLSRPH